MHQEKILQNTIKFVKKELLNAEGGHDWFHIERVYKNAILISKDEKVDAFVVSLGALLHDIADPKFYKGDETIGPKIAAEFLESQKVNSEIITHVIDIIKHISFKNSLDITGKKFTSKELEVVQDADRLDAIGAIGIARCYEKLLLLKDKMNTETGKKIALERHQFMEVFLTQFYNEWNGNQ